MIQTIFLLANYFIAFFGSVLWNFFLFTKAKNAADDDNQDFPYQKYFKKNWDNWVFTAICAPVLVWYGEDIVKALAGWTGWQLTFYKFYYLGAGILVELIYVGSAVLMKWKDSFVAKVHGPEPPKP
jgi:hypothetical protein